MAEYTVDDSPGYVYEKIADAVTERIAAGELPPGTALPGERDLASQYGVSLGTARQATRLLRQRGLLVTVRSKGTYVTPAAARLVRLWRGATESDHRSGLTTSSSVLWSTASPVRVRSTCTSLYDSSRYSDASAAGEPSP